MRNNQSESCIDESFSRLYQDEAEQKEGYSQSNSKRRAFVLPSAGDGELGSVNSSKKAEKMRRD